MASLVGMVEGRTVQLGRSTGRSYALDAARGFAILCMLADHVAMLAGDFQPVRLTVGRLAMPLFFLVSGHLVGRIGWRHAGVWVLGLLLPAVVWWIDNPNVLIWYATWAALIAFLRYADMPLWPLVAAALAFGANGYLDQVGSSFEPRMLCGLMALGTMLDRGSFNVFGRLPAWVAQIGRRPLSWYVGHVLFLHAVVLTVHASTGRWLV